jgi:hypothetical protein
MVRSTLARVLTAGTSRPALDLAVVGGPANIDPAEHRSRRAPGLSVSDSVWLGGRRVSMAAAVRPR